MLDPAIIASTSSAALADSNAGSYRVKFAREEFLQLVRVAKPKMIYHRKNMHFFAYDGFVTYTDQCENSNFSQRILDALEFSNYQWQK